MKKEKYNETERHEYIIQKCDSVNAKKVLDVGCGNGTRLTNELADWGFKVVGIDIDKPSIEDANRLKGKRKNPIYKNECISEHADKHDVILALGVLEHLPDKTLDLYLSEMNTIGDYFIFSIPYGYSSSEFIGRLGKYKNKILTFLGLKKLWMSPMPDSTCNLEGNMHVQYFTFKRFCNLLDKYGYDIVESHKFYRTILPQQFIFFCKKREQ